MRCFPGLVSIVDSHNEAHPNEQIQLIGDALIAKKYSFGNGWPLEENLNVIFRSPKLAMLEELPGDLEPNYYGSEEKLVVCRFSPLV